MAELALFSVIKWPCFQLTKTEGRLEDLGQVLIVRGAAHHDKIGILQVGSSELVYADYMRLSGTTRRLPYLLRQPLCVPKVRVVHN